jgi:signal transduction histidine kinase
MASRPSELRQNENRSTQDRVRTPGRYPTYMLAALLLAAFVAFAVTTYVSLRRELTQAATSRNAAVAHLAAVTVSERLERMVDLSVSLATRVRFADLVAKGEWDAAGEIMRGVPAEFPFLERLFLTDASGTLKVDEPALPGVRGTNFAFRDWFQGVRRDGRPYVSPVYQRAAEPRLNVVSVATSVRARAGGEVAGVLVLELTLDAFFDWVGSLDLEAEAVLIVVDSRGQVVHTSGVPAQGAITPLAVLPVVEALRQGRAGVESARDAEAGEALLFAFDPAKHGWGVVIRQPVRAAFAARDAQLMLLQVAYTLFGLLAATLVWTGMRVAARRREQLERTRRSLAQHAERLRILAEIDRAVVAEKPAEDVAAAVIRPLLELLGVPRAIVNRFDLARGEAEWVAAAGRQRIHVGAGVRFSLRLMGDVEALKRGESQLVNVHALPASAETQALLASDVRYYKVVPMIAGGELLGAISFGDRTAEFAPEQVAIAQEVATQLAIATVQARLLEAAHRHAQELESRVRGRTAELEAANEELAAFSYSVSHDLRAPLRAVDGYARMLQEDFAERLGEEGQRQLGVVRDESKRMGRLIDDLLAFSRAGRQAMQAARIDMTDLARTVALELASEFPQAQVQVGDLPPAAADPALLRQVWVNLIGNALKYSSKHPAPRVEIGGQANGAQAEFWVQDNGAGFDERYAHKLFGVFQRLHGAHEFPGTGVGLAIVQRVVARHGGRVWAAGKPGAGARFSFALPTSRSDA